MTDVLELIKQLKEAGVTGPNIVIVAVIVWVVYKHLPPLVTAHIAFLNSTKETQDKQTVILERMDVKLGAKLNSHGEAIEHTANGIIAHVEGKPDEAKQYANKAKEVVR